MEFKDASRIVLREILNNRDISGAEFGRSLGVTRARINNILTSDGIGTIKMLETIATKLNMTRRELFDLIERKIDS